MVADAVAPARLTAQKESTPAAQAAQSREQIEPGNSAAGAGADKVFFTLRVAYALKGHALHRTDPACGEVTYWAERWGLVRYLPTLHDAALFLAQIGGRL